MFQGRTGALGTKHGKERVIAPLLKKELGLEVKVPDNLDTDIFGTFTGEIKRLGSQIEAARAKALKAIELTGSDIGIASEGSFYPHPALGIVSCNREIVLLIDRTNNLEIIGQVITTDTNHAGKTLTTLESALDFARRVGFPSHSLIIADDKNPDNDRQLFKGIADEASLEAIVRDILAKKGSVYLETDMRAMCNPTRMRTISLAVENLIGKINTPCPACGRPGFEVVREIPGLPCGLCFQPTHLIQKTVSTCQKCGYSLEKLYPEGKRTADPMYCEYCNP